MRGAPQIFVLLDNMRTLLNVIIQFYQLIVKSWTPFTNFTGRCLALSIFLQVLVLRQSQTFKTPLARPHVTSSSPERKDMVIYQSVNHKLWTSLSSARPLHAQLLFVLRRVLWKYRMYRLASYVMNITKFSKACGIEI